MTIDEIKTLALRHGIVILDYETPTTLASRIGRVLGRREEEIDRRDILRVAEALDACVTGGGLPFLDETSEGGAALKDAMHEAMVEAGLIEEGDEDEGDGPARTFLCDWWDSDPAVSCACRSPAECDNPDPHARAREG